MNILFSQESRKWHLRPYCIKQLRRFISPFYRLVSNLYTKIISKWYLNVIRKHILSTLSSNIINKVAHYPKKIIFALTTILHSEIFKSLMQDGRKWHLRRSCIKRKTRFALTTLELINNQLPRNSAQKFRYFKYEVILP